MKRTIAIRATLVFSLCAAPVLAQQPYPQQYPPQQYPPQQYPPQQQPYPPQQQYPQQQPYPPQQYPQQQQGYMQPVPQQYGPAPMASQQGPMFGSQGQVILSAGRLFGLSFWSAKTEFPNNLTLTSTNTSINLLWGDSEQLAAVPAGNTLAFTTVVNPYSTPRLGLDFTVANNLSLGGSIAFVSRGGSGEASQQTASISVDSPSITAFAFAPRVGYILALNPLIGFWFKGGVTYFSHKETTTLSGGGSSTTHTSTLSGFSLNLEPELVVTPVPHFGLTVGPVADIALSGNDHEEDTGANSMSNDVSTKISNYGVIFGILGWI